MSMAWLNNPNALDSRSLPGPLLEGFSVIRWPCAPSKNSRHSCCHDMIGWGAWRVRSFSNFEIQCGKVSKNKACALEGNPKIEGDKKDGTTEQTHIMDAVQGFDLTPQKAVGMGST